MGGPEAGYTGRLVAASFVSVGEVRCDAPPAGAPVSADVSVSTDAGVSWALPGALFTRYDATADAELVAVSPRASGVSELRTVTLRGP